ncbi:MAG: hypothetical protein C4532_08735 [Candidatus Abyssobacteria bacterium SURF_17]|uniref:Uncharacterized protein n=1 Tax=Candidatus Abyssobacteria bacterium SURF_17 TaxID=2093361 RepID=A0A419EZA1_9BACT|nr:MAG: hypothetical protein C4532_08735 [Candidatus Abyssubacteria bacterium SURF_17]
MIILRILLSLLLLGLSACAVLDDGYSTHYGLTNPENPPVHPNLTDETYMGGTVSQREAEEYERKYHEHDIFKPTEPEATGVQESEAGE